PAQNPHAQCVFLTKAQAIHEWLITSLSIKPARPEISPIKSRTISMNRAAFLVGTKPGPAQGPVSPVLFPAYKSPCRGPGNCPGHWDDQGCRYVPKRGRPKVTFATLLRLLWLTGALPVHDR